MDISVHKDAFKSLTSRWDKVTRWPRRTYSRIRHTIKWLPVIWKDQDWDQAWLWEMLDFKLKSMEGFYRSDYAWSMEAGRVADQIKRCRLVLARIIADDYIINATLYHDKKWGDVRWNFGEMNDAGFGSLTFTRPGGVVAWDEKTERKEFIWCSRHADYMKKQDIDYLFKLMGRYVNSWWD
jgi:hypothetical protein